jgi:hypothetical protein
MWITFPAGSHSSSSDDRTTFIGVCWESGTIRIGTGGTRASTFTAGISGVTVAGSVTVIVDTNGHLGTIVSSERFRDAIKPKSMEKASEAILALKPLTFRYNHELDPDGKWSSTISKVAESNKQPLFAISRHISPL